MMSPSVKATARRLQRPQPFMKSSAAAFLTAGDIYQMVSDSDRSNHCMGANQNSLGIEHVGSETDSLTAPQAAASAALIRWLLEQYHILRTNIFGHDFAPGYSRLGGTGCPDRLFGPVHAQATIAACVEANV
jgi:hypothetical protein